MGNVMKSQNSVSRTETDNSTFKITDHDTLVVLSDYPCRDVSEPIFRMGEKLRGLAEEGCWWKVRSFQTGVENYIPVTHVAKVYHGWLFEGVARQKAEELLWLPGNSAGSFMVRESPKERGVYSLSVRHRSIKHYKIFRMANSWYYISPRLTFQCLEDMVNHYSDSSDGICCVLTAPCQANPTNVLSTTSQAPPVVMRRNFDWKNVDRSHLLSPSTEGSPMNRENMVSYGVRNSIASYLSLTGLQDTGRINKRKNKSKSVCMLSDYSNGDMNFDE
ncbi:src like adaptor 1a [Chanos chanos]|uniref:Src-like-adapter n=1 Tax=Chanos chanos TaxID=29144 RepID=A0A6J2WJA2_CHACN|nr:src-like-adapter [Chanos chanos]